MVKGIAYFGLTTAKKSENQATSIILPIPQVTFILLGFKGKTWMLRPLYSIKNPSIAHEGPTQTSALTFIGFFPFQNDLHR